MNSSRIIPFRALAAAGLAMMPLAASAMPGLSRSLDLSGHAVGYLALALFGIAYVFVVLELRKSKPKPIMLAAALIWVAIAVVYKGEGMSDVAEAAIRHDVLDYGELQLFLIVSLA